MTQHPFGRLRRRESRQAGYRDWHRTNVPVVGILSGCDSMVAYALDRDVFQCMGCGQAVNDREAEDVLCRLSLEGEWPEA